MPTSKTSGSRSREIFIDKQCVYKYKHTSTGMDRRSHSQSPQTYRWPHAHRKLSRCRHMQVTQHSGRRLCGHPLAHAGGCTGAPRAGTPARRRQCRRPRVCGHTHAQKGNLGALWHQAYFEKQAWIEHARQEANAVYPLTFCVKFWLYSHNTHKHWEI